MFVAFTQILFRKLIENDFNSIKVNELNRDSKNLILAKQIGPVLYIVNIINRDQFILDTYTEHIQQVESTIGYNNDYAQHIIVLNLLVANNVDEGLIDYIHQDFFDSEKKIHNICWAVDLNRLELVRHTGSDQLLNISTIIKDILSESFGPTQDKVELDSLAKKAVIESALAVKSSDSWLTFGIMGINVLIFILMRYYGQGKDITDLLIEFGANSPEHIFYKYQYYRLFTSMFIHIDLAHLMHNSFALYLFGSRVEKYFGKKAFIVIYIIAGLVGSMASVLYSPYVSAGASGAIYGLIGAICVLSYQKNKQIDGLSFYIILLIIVTGLGLQFLDANIGHFAHIAGMIAGYAIGFLFCPKGIYDSGIKD